MDRSSSGIGTAIALVLVSALGSYLLLWAPPRADLGDSRAGKAAVESEIQSGDERKLLADQATEDLADPAVKTSLDQLVELAQEAGVPEAAIQVSGDKVLIEARGSAVEVGGWASAISGATYLDPSGQLRGEKRLGRVSLSIESRSGQSALRAELARP
jgi:hypothetical protein